MKSLALAAFPLLLIGSPAHAQSDSRSQPVACIYYGTLRGIDREKVIGLVQKGMEATTNEERMILQKIGESAARCRTRYGWGEPRRQAAIQYFNARNIYDSARAVLTEYEIRWPMVSGYVDTLDDTTRQAFRSGSVTGAMISAAIEQLKVAGAAKLGTLTQDNAQPVGRAVATAIAAAVVQKDAEAAYAR